MPHVGFGPSQWDEAFVRQLEEEVLTLKSKKCKRDRSLYMTNTKGYIFLVRACNTIVAIRALLDGAEGKQW